MPISLNHFTIFYNLDYQVYTNNFITTFKQNTIYITLKNILLTATFSITILTLFLAPIGTNLAFAGGACQFQCGVEESAIFQACLFDTISLQFPFGDVDLCNGLADDFFFACAKS